MTWVVYSCWMDAEVLEVQHHWDHAAAASAGCCTITVILRPARQWRQWRHWRQRGISWGHVMTCTSFPSLNESLNGDKFGSVDQLKIGMRGPTKNRQTVDIRGMDSPYWFPTVWTLISNPLELWAWNSQNRSAWGGELGWCFCRTKQSAEQWLRSTPVGWWLRGSYYYLGVVSTGTSISTAVKLI